jgi:peptidoglycan/xylan/chitin deacetylase (PgdA/CDA1 family)
VVLVATVLAGPVAPSPALAGTTVSLTFDDGRGDNYPVLKDMLAQRGMRATFYVNSAKVGTSSYHLTWPQIEDFARNGNEIGGHTLTHPHLPALTYDQQRAEICNDRQALIDHGFNPVSFAYPYAEETASAKQLAQEFGYSSARDVCCGSETIPPRDAYLLHTPPSSNDLSTLKGYITQTENAGGGWVILVFHSIGANSDGPLPISEADMAAFLDWLGARAANGTVVKTVGETMGASPPPAPSAISLTTRAYKVKGSRRVDLTWNGARSTRVDIFRDGAKIATPANTGAYTDALRGKGGGTYRYKVCEEDTTVCSNESRASF